MKATGIVRRIDDLGRVVIPKEIRRTMRIREGDPLEIYTDKEGGVIFKKYSPLNGVGEFAIELCETLQKTTNLTVAITDRDSCIAVAGPARKNLIDKKISSELESIMEERHLYEYDNQADPSILCDSEPDYFAQTVAPILSEGDILGSLVFADTKENLHKDESHKKLAQTISIFLGRYMES